MDSRVRYDSQVQNETSSDQFVLHARLPSLQEMAYNQIAIAVWYKYRSTPSGQRSNELNNRYDHKSTKKLELMDCHKLMKTLTMPRFMKENLKKYLKRVRQETIRCIQYFRFELLSENLEEYRIPRVDWEYFVWCSNGRINYKSTAIKLLYSGVLTQVQKFAIVCNFCLENEIKIFDLNHLPVETFIPKVNEYLHSSLFYWICYLKNELHTITPVSFLGSYHYGLKAEAFEYFWNRLNAADQVSIMCDRLHFAFEDSYWRDSWFYKMSHDQLTNLLFRQPAAMISVFIKKIDMPEWAIMAWKRCKNRISNEQFVELLKSVLALDRFVKNPIIHRERKMDVLLEIWNTADDSLKNYAAAQPELEEAVVQRILFAKYSRQLAFPPDDQRVWKKLAPSSFKFLLKFLSLKSADFRKNLFGRDTSFFFNFDFHVVHEICELCLPNSQGTTGTSKMEFINVPTDYGTRPYFCIILYTVEDQDELNERLLRSFENLNIPSKDILRKFIETLAICDKRVQQTRYTSDFLRLSMFINKILQENMSTVLKMKESYFSSLISATSDPYERYGSWNELSKLIEQEFVHEHLQELKRRLAKILQTEDVKQWAWYVRNYEKFERVFSWCFENEEEMFLQVKRCIPINDIIGEVLGLGHGKTSRRITTFSNNLERFLEWYFSVVEEEEMISFKHSLTNDPETAKIRAVERIKQYDRDQQLYRKFLRWIGNRIGFNVKRSTYGIMISFFFFLFFAILSVIYVHL